MHQYERCGAMGFGRKRRKTKIHLTFEQMRMTFHRVGFPIALCGPGTQPAEDAPEDDGDDESPTAGTAATHFDSPGGRHILRWAPAAPSIAHPAVAVTDDEWFLLFALDDEVPPAAAAETAASAYEAQPPATDEAPTKQPPKRRVSFSTDEPEFHSVPADEPSTVT